MTSAPRTSHHSFGASRSFDPAPLADGADAVMEVGNQWRLEPIPEAESLADVLVNDVKAAPEGPFGWCAISEDVTKIRDRPSGRSVGFPDRRLIVSIVSPCFWSNLGGVCRAGRMPLSRRE